MSEFDAMAAAVRSPEHEGEEGAGKWIVVAIVAIGVFMVTLDSSIVNISLPAIAQYFGVPLNGTVEWVIISYLIANVALLLTGGRLADMVGRKPIWIAGLALFTLGSALCGLAPSLGMLVAARAFQGLGGSLMLAVSPAMLTSAFPRGEFGRALGWNAAVVGIGISAGPALGGIITDHFTWRWIFFLNVPVGLLGIAATLLFLTERVRRKRTQLDIPGAVLLAIGLGGLMLGISFGQEWGWTSPLLLGVLVVSILALVAMILVEIRAANPIIDFSLFTNRIFVSANVSLVLSFVSLFAVSFLLPFYLVQLRDFSLTEAGLLQTPLSLTLVVLSPTTGALADRFGSRWLAAGGLAIACFGLLLISTLDTTSSVAMMIAVLIILGAGESLFFPPNNSTLMGAAPRHRRGVASSMMATSRAIGQSASVALSGAIFTMLGGATAGSVLGSRASELPPAELEALQATFLHAYQVTILVCCAIAVVGIFTSLARGHDRGGRPG